MKKKGIITWIRKKKVRYAAAGTLCLAVAIGILVLGLGIGSRAERPCSWEQVLNINFETTTDGNGKTIYLIDSAEQMSKLGQASDGADKRENLPPEAGSGDWDHIRCYRNLRRNL